MGQALNQAKQLFVAKTYAGENGITDSSPAGTILAKASAEDIILSYVNAKGQRTRSDIMPICNIMYANVAKADDQRDYIKTWTVTLDSSVNSGRPVVGQDYILNVKIANYLDSSDINEYLKFGAVHATDGMTAAAFYKKMAISLAKNFSRETDKPVKVFIGDTEITKNTKEEDITSATSIVIKEAEPYWQRNSFHYSRYRITIEDACIVAGEDKAEKHWASIEEATSEDEFIGNGMKTADLEDFVLSLHGDYRQGGTYPLSSQTMVDPAEEYNYLSIHYCYIGANENPQRSEKDIVVVSTDPTVINTIVGVINQATGKSFKTIS